jgi:tetratricopeptide (TPR) repeat protein
LVVSDWYYLVEREQKGPVTEEAIKAAMAAHQFSSETLVWRQGMETWLPANKVPAFAAEAKPLPVSSTPPPVPAKFLKTAAVAPSGGCAVCHSPNVVHGYATLLCQPCRDKLIHRPLPPWLLAAAAVLIMLIPVAATRMPREINADVALERGNAAEARGDHAGAETYYQQALASYPDSPAVLRGLAAAAFHAGDQDTAVNAANKLIGPDGKAAREDRPLIEEIRNAQPK